MKTQYGFTRFDTIDEFKVWLDKQPKYGYTGLQVHNTFLPDYSCFYKTGGGHEDELARQKSMKDFHVVTNKWPDIAQHFTIFPNGRIVTGRKLSNTTAIGIKGWNTGKICIEIYGNFDKGKDIMKAEQKQAVLGAYYYLAKKFGIPFDTAHIRPHCWFTAGGTYLGKYNAGRSAKTCPGTNFWGVGCSQAGFAKFLTDVKNYKAGTAATPVADKTPVAGTTDYIVRVICDELNIRKGPGTSYDKTGELHKGDAYTIVEEKNGWGKLKFDLGWISLGTKYVEKVKK